MKENLIRSFVEQNWNTNIPSIYSSFQKYSSICLEILIFQLK